MAYTRVNWEDLPSTNTAINATNLNKMDLGIFDLDNNKADITYVDNYTDGTKPMGSIVVDDINCKNLFDYNSSKFGYVLGGNGAESTASGFLISDYIPVTPNTTYTISRVFNNVSGAENSMRVGYYQQDKTFIDRPASSDNPYTITTPSNCYYVRLSYQYQSQGQNSNDKVQLEIGSEATPYTPYKNFENEEVYSEGEIKIGTWIDGKPLYRKVFTITSLTSSNTNLVDVSGLSIDFAKISGTIITSTGAKFPINLYDSASNYSVIILSDAGYIRGRGAIGSGTLSKCIVILEYTKTTSGTRMLNTGIDEENR